MTIFLRRREIIATLGGAAVTSSNIWPLTARAQQRMRRVGVLMGGAEADLESPARVRMLQQGLERLGWAVGRNLQIDYRWTMADVDRTKAGGAELLRLAPDVLVGDGSTRTAVLMQSTRTIPIVFVLVADPIAQGFVQSYARPSTNVTGFTNQEPTVGPKYLEILKEIAPHLRRVAVVSNPATSPSSLWRAQALEAAAQRFTVEVIDTPVRQPADIEAVLSKLGAEPGGGFIVPPDNFTTVHRKLILDLSIRHRLPAIYAFRYFVADGGLISYGVDPIDPFARAAVYIDRILRGQKPADLPVQAPVKYETVLNMRTARALGLTVPDIVLLRADEVIE